MGFLEKKFADTGYKIPELLKEIVLSEAFYRVLPPSLDTTSADASGTQPLAAKEEKS